jgi:hypothetical protein
VLGHINSVERPRHPHVGEEHIEAVWSVEQSNGFDTVPSLYHVETLVLESFRGQEANEAFVLNEQDPQRGHCVIQEEALATRTGLELSHCGLTLNEAEGETRCRDAVHQPRCLILGPGCSATGLTAG